MARKVISRFSRVVYSTEEFTQLQTAVKQAGGKIIGTKSLREGAGISVTIDVDEDKRQF